MPLRCVQGLCECVRHIWQDSAGHGWDDEKGELTCVEVYNSPAAMDCHIGTCFEFYVKMLNHMTMTK